MILRNSLNYSTLLVSPIFHTLLTRSWLVVVKDKNSAATIFMIDFETTISSRIERSIEWTINFC